MINKSNIVFLFSGQGSHYRDMGKELYLSNTVFRDSINRADRIIYQNVGISLIDELFHYDDQIFDSVLITHPAIVAVEIAMIEVMKSLGITPDAVVGVSLGEFAAGVAAGIWTAEEAIITSIEQARIVIQHVNEGGMTVVIGNKSQQLLEYMEGKELYHDSVNFKGCFTVSGLKNELDKFDVFLGEKGLVYQRLDVEYPFHSPLLDLAGLFWFQEEIQIQMPISSDVKMYSPLNGGLLEGNIPANYFWDVICKPFNFPNIVKELENDLQGAYYLDLGPSGTMATFMKYILGPTQGNLGESVVIPFLSQHHEAIQKLDKFSTEILSVKEI